MKTNTYATFSGFKLVARGSLEDMLAATKPFTDGSGGAEDPLLIFDLGTGRQVDFDFRGSLEEVIEKARALRGPQNGFGSPESADEASGKGEAAQGRRGRPKLGVVSAEVTLLPRHWQWLSSQPAKASGTLRRLVEEAMKKDASDPRRKAEILGTLLWSLAGNVEAFEDASRALYALDLPRLFAISDRWPGDLGGFVREWFSTESGGGGGVEVL